MNNESQYPKNSNDLKSDIGEIFHPLMNPHIDYLPNSLVLCILHVVVLNKLTRIMSKKNHNLLQCLTVLNAVLSTGVCFRTNTLPLLLVCGLFHRRDAADTQTVLLDIPAAPHLQQVYTCISVISLWFFSSALLWFYMLVSI